ncbi:histidine kinase [Chryseobacterium piperi]|uniref:histidine kinase n=1 Tax=Chryseobacterium piperi TaxID=558152 RepID=A0A086ALD8_9FLAO|nr:HAMP domain-containing sensor histidine kinase [Chryseobacterium piperi]ASW73564.1 sensor histidine kinase [Chryseobacterium piperi]KFF17502.1 histidine kinase [Chryseobacterium piperi]
MQIKTRLTILFTIIMATILMIFAFIIYYSATKSRENEFYALLKKEAYTKANLFLNAQVDKRTLQEIYHNNRKTLNEVEVAIYNTDHKLLYHDAVDIDFVKETPKMLGTINSKGEIDFYQDDWQVIGVVYPYKGQKYLVTAASFDQYGYSKINNLLKTMVVVFIFSMIVIFLAGRIFSRKAFQPVNEMTEKARNISATNLDLRLETTGNKDELSQLANTFNDMLNRLENSFDSQKSFVSNISHELRTPLAAIITELELSVNKDRTNEEYKVVISNALNDAKKLARLSNSLLDFAKASYDPTEISFKPVRIDEVLLDARQQVQNYDHDYKIDLNFRSDIEKENQILVYGNEYLLKVAFVNLFENGCKFSEDHKSTVSIIFGNDTIVLNFTDEGIGIPENDLNSIFLPFHRGENKEFADGNGIGLPLTKKIVDLHKGTLTVTSQKNTGTTFTVELPHL